MTTPSATSGYPSSRIAAAMAAHVHSTSISVAAVSPGHGVARGKWVPLGP